MELNELIDSLFQKYGDRSKLPNDAEQLKDLFFVYVEILKALEAEKNMLEQMAIRTETYEKAKIKAKILLNKL